MRPVTIYARRSAAAVAFAAWALWAGCEQGAEGLGAAPEDEGVAQLDDRIAAVVDTWREAGLGVEELRSLEGDAEAPTVELGGSCAAATVAGLPVVLCRFPSPEDAEGAEEKGLELVGEATGLSLSSDELLLIAADRDETDPDGRNLNELANAFREAGEP